MVNAERINLNELITHRNIECGCMVCHLPLDEEHGPIEWKLTWRWPGPFPEAGVETMLLCDPCFRDWVDDPAFFGGAPEAMHKV